MYANNLNNALKVILTQKYYQDKKSKKYYVIDLFAGRAVMRLFLEREVRGSNHGPVKSYTVLPTARHRCDISSKEAVLPGCNDVRWAPPTRYMLRHDTASTMNDF